MAIFKPRPHPSQDPNSSLRVPATKRISVSASQRLSTILEGSRDMREMPPPTVPLRSMLRPTHRGAAAVPMTQHPAFRTQETLHAAAPPAYGAYHTSSIAESEDLTAPVEGEKLAELRRRGNPTRRSRGGWLRLLILLGVLLVVIGLAVGLGVGLTVGRRSSDSSSNNSSSVTGGTSSDQLPQPFPLGERSFVTALRSQNTSCTSNAATWRCYPYTTFASNNASSLATFNWIISNTSSMYAFNTTGSTSSTGIPANLSISSANNPFAISFTSQNLTYISESGNSSSARYTFNITLPKVVVPLPAITSNGQASQCFFNSTVFTGNIYLESARTYPDVALRDATTIGGYGQWPYAVEITQISPGGSSVPDCYETINGVIGDRIINGLTAQPASSQCICDYSNF